MTIPGFTAEVTLYRTNGHYRMAGHFSHAEEALHPALFALALSSCDPDCLGGCLPNCEGRFDRIQCRRECGAQCCMAYV